MIENNIFQTWKSKSIIPADFKYWSDTVRKCNPDFVHYFWDDQDNRNFIAENYPWFLKTYDAYPIEIYRVDAVRYFWLYHFGGVYIDMDCECLRPLDQLCRENSGVVLGRMGSDTTFVHSIPNAVMMSSSREEFWLYVFHLMMSLQNRKSNPEDLTGSIALKATVDALNCDVHEEHVRSAIEAVRRLLPPELQPQPRNSRIRILPSEYFFPVNWADPIHEDQFRRPIIGKGQLLSRQQAIDLFPNTYIVSYWAHSWDYLEQWPAETPIKQSGEN